MQISDQMVRAAEQAFYAERERQREANSGWAVNREKAMRAALEAALSEMWQDISTAPDNRPSLYGCRTQFGEWYQAKFENSLIPRKCGYTHYAELLPPPKIEIEG